MALADAINNVTDVQSYFRELSSAVQQNIGKAITNGPEGTISAKTQVSVDLIVDSLAILLQNVQEINPDFVVDLQSCLTLKVEAFHSLHHHKNNELLHPLEYAKSFGNTVKESLKKLL